MSAKLQSLVLLFAILLLITTSSLANKENGKMRKMGTYIPTHDVEGEEPPPTPDSLKMAIVQTAEGPDNVKMLVLQTQPSVTAQHPHNVEADELCPPPGSIAIIRTAEGPDSSKMPVLQTQPSVTAQHPHDVEADEPPPSPDNA